MKNSKKLNIYEKYSNQLIKLEKLKKIKEEINQKFTSSNSK